MTDVVSPAVRSAMMAGIRNKNTRPECLVRKQLFARGYRYRLHAAGLPGKPDLVLPKYKALVFVHGCFWHGHDCHLFKWPKTREAFWREKISSNQQRDLNVRQQLLDAGWRVAVIWECALKGREKLDLAALTNIVDEWLQSDCDTLDLFGDLNG